MIKYVGIKLHGVENVFVATLLLCSKVGPASLRTVMKLPPFKINGVVYPYAYLMTDADGSLSRLTRWAKQRGEGFDRLGDMLVTLALQDWVKGSDAKELLKRVEAGLE